MADKKLSSKIGSKTQGAKLEKESVPKKPSPKTADRKARSGWGGLEDYAHAVADGAKNLEKGSNTSFLGQPKKTVSAEDAVDSGMLYKGKKGVK